MKAKPSPARTVEDGRGILMFPLEGGGLVPALKRGNPRKIHLATVRPGAVRGNHRHPHHAEYLVFLGTGGRIILRQKGKIRDMKVQNAVVKVPRNVAHAVVNRGKDTLVLFCFYGGPSAKRLTAVREVVA